jgi:hypothetical protein
VLVMADHLPSSQPSRKLDQKWRGLFKVMKKIGEAVYELKLPESWQGNRVFNEGRLKGFNQSAFKSQDAVPTRPELELVNQTKEEYEVHKILSERGTGHSVEYLVRWEGYGLEDDTWEPVKNLTHTKEVIRDFRAQGWATKWGEITASVTEEIKRRREEAGPTGVKSQPARSLQTRPDQFREGDEPGIHLNQVSQRESSGKKRDSGTSSANHGSSAELTGKLCRRMMALIQWRVGANKAVTEHVVQVLEEWLCR